MKISSILWVLFGLGLPLSLAVLTIPILLGQIGPERFGILALAWGLLGYGGVLDLGIGRAVTQKISDIREGAEREQIPQVIATAVGLARITSGIGMMLIVVTPFFGIQDLIKTDTINKEEIILSILLLGMTLPMQAISAVYRGICEAHLDFRGVSVIRIFLGVVNFGGPCLVAVCSNKIHWLIATLTISRFISLMSYKLLSDKCVAGKKYTSVGSFNRDMAGKLLRFGGWATITSIVSPLLAVIDRFSIGSILSAAAITIYVVPYEMTIQTLLFVSVVTAVLFPVITNQISTSPRLAQRTFRNWLWLVTGVMFLTTLSLAYIMPDLLRLWIGEGISEESVQVGRIICIGVFFNSIGGMFFALLHALGKARSTGILHAIEFPLYVLLLFILIHSHGVVGCAIAWSIRTACDAAALAWISSRSNFQKGK